MDKYTLVPYVAHRDPVIKLGKTFNDIRDNMISFLIEEYTFPDDYDQPWLDICYRVRDYPYESIDELIKDFDKVCVGYAIVKG